MPLRIAIVGSPRAGKTTLARQYGVLLGLPVLHSDDYIGMGWSAASAEIATRIGACSEGVFEGVAVVRALRKMLLSGDAKPVELCIVMDRPLLPLSAGQERMRRACETILAGVKPEFLLRGVQVLNHEKR